MHAGSSKVLEEMREVEDVVETDEATVSGGIPLDRMETGRASAAPKSRRSKLTEGARNLSNFLLGPVFVQAFVLTFLGEWGDRSQIATIALGAAHVRRFPKVFLSDLTILWWTECIYRQLWHRPRSLIMHSTGCVGWKVC